MPTADIEWKTIKPPEPLANFVESFWMLANHSDQAHHIVILPDGRFDIIFSWPEKKLFRATLKCLDIKPEQTTIPANTIFFAVSFKLLAIEYLLDEKVNSLLNQGIRLPTGFWDITKDDLTDFDAFCKKVSAKILVRIKPNIDSRKQKLFDLIYEFNGTQSVSELAEKVFWSSRQINRYFNQQFGISLKAYCNILRFKSSLHYIKNGKLFPEFNYSDRHIL